MNNIDILLKVAEYLGHRNILRELEAIDFRSKQENANIILPLVGEFSSGKTTLINSLTDCKQLETATKPTTATIYEVHFGCDSCIAKILTKSGEIIEINNIEMLKNETLVDAKVVTVFDTSSNVPSTTVLVDTPGLSSPDLKHKETLVNFLPKADGILLVSDINQQITKSLTDFIETMKLSKKTIFLVLTKSDTKSEQDVESAKKYISDNCQIPVKQIAVVSAASNNLDELYSLLDNVQKNKKEILKQVDAQRMRIITHSLIEHIEELMSASSSDDKLDEAIRRCKYELDKISRNIDQLVDSMSDDIENQDRAISRKFEDIIFSRLNSLVAGKSNNLDSEAISTINNTTSLLMNEYRVSIQTLLREKANSRKGSENEVALNSLADLDLSSIKISGLSYNLDLNTIGHEYDGWIKTGAMAVAAVGAVVAVASTGGAAVGALSAATTLDNVIDVVDTVSDVGSIISNQKTVGRIEKATGFVSNTINNTIPNSNTIQQSRQEAGSNKSVIDSMIGSITDKMISKPQRIRAIRNYIDSSLTPEFKLELGNVSKQLISSIRCNLQNEATEIINQKTLSMNQLKTELKDKNDAFTQRLEQLRQFKTTLLTF